MYKTKRTIVAILTYLIFSGIPARAQTNVVKLSTREAIENGQPVLEIVADIDSKYHVYGMEKLDGPIATEFKFTLPEGIELVGEVMSPEGKRHHDEGFGIDVTWHSGKAVFKQKLKLNATAKTSDIITVAMTYQACTESYCLPPKTIRTTHTISQQWIGLSAGTIKPLKKINPNQAVETISPQNHSVADPENKSSASHDSVAQTASDKVSTIQERTASYESLRQESLASFIGLAFLTGLLALLTPCVFPMIPITVSYFTKHSASSRAGAVRQSVIYVVGIIASFTLFGWLMSLVVGATGAQNFAANAWVNLAIGILFIVFAMSLFGVFEIRLPSFIVNFSQQQAHTGQTIGTLMAGVTFTLVSFTCTVQFLGLLMVAAADGEWFLPVIGMLCFATAFSTPFFFLSLFPQYLANLPKSGGWLHATKIVMGLVEIAAAFKFFSNVDLVWDLQWLTRPAMLSIWITLFGVSGIYLLGKIRWSVEDEVEEIGFGRTMTGLLFISFTVYLLSGLFGNPLQADMDAYLPPSDYGVVRTAGNAKSTESHGTWIENYEAALREARTSGKPLFIDFTGKTCTNCRLMEKTMFTRADVQSYFDRMVLTRLWTDFGEDMERYQELQQRLVGSVALPFYVIITPDEKVLARFGGLERDPEIFKSFLADGLQKSQK